jgi:hypothetical protein
VARLGAEADVHGWSYHLGRITKRGNRYLRTLFMQGARVILLRPVNWAKHSFGVWLTAAARRLHHNVLAAALANKLARIAWTVLAQGRSYEARIDVIRPAIRGIGVQNYSEILRKTGGCSPRNHCAILSLYLSR